MNYYDTLQLFRIKHIDSYFDSIRRQSVIWDVSNFALKRNACTDFVVVSADFQENFPATAKRFVACAYTVDVWTNLENNIAEDKADCRLIQKFILTDAN
jgi:hypothetical protein